MPASSCTPSLNHHHSPAIYICIYLFQHNIYCTVATAVWMGPAAEAVEEWEAVLAGKARASLRNGAWR
jgi:hypothetical protein